MVFNFPPSRVQQRSIPKFKSYTVYPGWARRDPASVPNVMWLQFQPLRQASRVKWLVQHWLVGKSLEVPAFPFLFSFCWQDVVVAVCHLPNSTSHPVGRPCKGSWEVASNLHVPGRWYFQACLPAHGVNIYFFDPFFIKSN